MPALTDSALAIETDTGGLWPGGGGTSGRTGGGGGGLGGGGTCMHAFFASKVIIAKLAMIQHTFPVQNDVGPASDMHKCAHAADGLCEKTIPQGSVNACVHVHLSL